MKHVIQAENKHDVRYFKTAAALTNAVVGNWIDLKNGKPGTSTHEVLVLSDQEGHDPSFSQKRFNQALQEILDEKAQLPSLLNADGMVTGETIAAHEDALKKWKPTIAPRLRAVLPAGMK